MVRPVNQEPSEDVPASKKKVSVNQLQRALSALVEETLRVRHAEQREIQHKTEVSSDDFTKSRAELISLHAAFKKFAVAGELLPKERGKKALNYIGIQPKKDISWENDQVSFGEFVQLVEQTRLDICGDLRASLAAHFLAAPGASTEVGIPAANVEEFLDKLGLAPLSGIEKDAFSSVLWETMSYSGGAGNLQLEEVLVLPQRAQEFIIRCRREAELRAAQECGFEEAYLDDIRAVFDDLDKDGSGALDVDEAWQAMTRMGVLIRPELFDATFRHLDEDSSRTLQFTEFLKLMRKILNREGVFAGDRNIAYISDLTKPESILMMSCLRMASAAELVAMEKETTTESFLQAKISQRIGVSENQSLQSAVKVKSVKDLCLLCKRLSAAEAQSPRGAAATRRPNGT